MTNAMTPQVVRSYLAQLDAALGGVPDDVRRDIVSGVAEELAGLNASAAAARIESMGDPKFIAAEARAETAAPPQAKPERSPGPSGDARWYIVLAALLVAFGGVVVPVVGWVVGIALVWLSKIWHTWEKLVATLTVVAAVAVAMLSSALTSSNFAGWHATLLLGVLGNVVVGIWLLWRAKGRTSSNNLEHHPDPE